MSALLGSGSGIPIGASILMLDAPNPVIDGASEYLRTGTIKPYDASYASAIAAAPQLRVFGSNAKTYGVATSATPPFYQKVGSNYFSVQTGSVQYGTILNALSSNVVVAGADNTIKPVSNGAYSLISCGGNAAPSYTSNGSSFVSCSGIGSAFPCPPVLCYGNSSWLALASLTANAGERTYINAASPTGTWTQGSSGAYMGMTQVKGLAYGAGVFVAGGISASTTGKLCYSATAGGLWTDCTPSSISWTTTGGVSDVVFDGTVHIAAAFSANSVFAGILTSPDGIAWTNRGNPVDAGTNPINGGTFTGAITPSVINTTLCTDGAGTTTLTCRHAAGSRPVILISVDHGVTWSVAQIYIGKAPQSACMAVMSYVDGRWVFNHSGQYQSLVDIGTSLSTPDYIGQQLQLAAGQFVRIK